MPSATFTVTAKTGPARQVTTGVFSNVSHYSVDVARSVLTLFQNETPIKEFDLNGVTTFTTTISGGNYAVTIS